jgi:peptide/nickel transport system permease protein
MGDLKRRSFALTRVGAITCLALARAGAILFVSLTLVFVACDLAIGDPSKLFLRDELDAAVAVRRAEALGLYQPFAARYLDFMRSAVSLDFGQSLHDGRAVRDLVGQALPASLALGLMGTLLAFLIGVLGAGSLLHPRLLQFRAMILGAVAGLHALPSFVLALLLAAFLRATFPSLAPSAPAVGLAEGEAIAAFLKRIAQSMMFPLIVFLLAYTPPFMMFADSVIGPIAQERFILVARSKGLDGRTVFRRHVLRAAAAQLLGVVGLSVPMVIGGAVAVEWVCDWPGVGRLMVISASRLDVPTILCITTLAAMGAAVGSLLADIGARLADPRLREGRSTI